jgi:hypothetical protein
MESMVEEIWGFISRALELAPAACQSASSRLPDARTSTPAR